MKKFLLRLLSFAALGALMLGLTGCGGSIAINYVAGPGGTGSFSGTTVTINPTLQFGAGGAVTYTNTESGSSFPASAGVTGTYTYTPSSDATTGTLAVTLPAPVGAIEFTLRNFAVRNGNVTSFDAVYQGRAFAASVTTGTLPAKPASFGSGSPSGGNSLAANEALAAAIPATMQGSYQLSFFKATFGEGMGSTLIPDGDTKTFVVGASTLTVGDKTLGNPVFRNNNAKEWIFKDGSIEYEVSIAVAGGLNEINVGGTGGSPWLGQYNTRR